MVLWSSSFVVVVRCDSSLWSFVVVVVVRWRCLLSSLFVVDVVLLSVVLSSRFVVAFLLSCCRSSFCFVCLTLALTLSLFLMAYRFRTNRPYKDSLARLPLITLVPRFLISTTATALHDTTRCDTALLAATPSKYDDVVTRDADFMCLYERIR